MPSQRHHPLEVLFTLAVLAESCSTDAPPVLEVLDELRDHPPSKCPGLWGPSFSDAPAVWLDLERDLANLRGLLDLLPELLALQRDLLPRLRVAQEQLLPLVRELLPLLQQPDVGRLFKSTTN